MRGKRKSDVELTAMQLLKKTTEHCEVVPSSRKSSRVVLSQTSTHSDADFEDGERDSPSKEFSNIKGEFAANDMSDDDDLDDEVVLSATSRFKRTMEQIQPIAEDSARTIRTSQEAAGDVKTSQESTASTDDFVAPDEVSKEFIKKRGGRSGRRVVRDPVEIARRVAVDIEAIEAIVEADARILEQPVFQKMPTELASAPSDGKSQSYKLWVMQCVQVSGHSRSTFNLADVDEETFPELAEIPNIIAKLFKEYSVVNKIQKRVETFCEEEAKIHRLIKDSNRSLLSAELVEAAIDSYKKVVRQQSELICFVTDLGFESQFMQLPNVSVGMHMKLLNATWDKLDDIRKVILQALKQMDRYHVFNDQDESVSTFLQEAASGRQHVEDVSDTSLRYPTLDAESKLRPGGGPLRDDQRWKTLYDLVTRMGPCAGYARWTSAIKNADQLEALNMLGSALEESKQEMDNGEEALERVLERGSKTLKKLQNASPEKLSDDSVLEVISPSKKKGSSSRQSPRKRS